MHQNSFQTKLYLPKNHIEFDQTIPYSPSLSSPHKIKEILIISIFHFFKLFFRK